MSASAPEPALDGLPLPEDLRARLLRLSACILEVDPLRPAADVRSLAEAALRATAVRTRTGWASRRTFALDGGRGPSLRLR